MLAYANVNGENVLEGTLHVPNVGPWWADVVFEGAPDLVTGDPVTLSLGTLELRGTMGANNGVFAAQRRARIVGGGGGWQTLVSPQHYHNDAGVLARTIADDAARLAGENIGTFAPTAQRVGVAYVRQSVTAARVLQDTIGNVAWWVDADGLTNVGEREAGTVAPSDYMVVSFDPAQKMLTLAVDDLTKIGIGSVFENGLEAPLTARELEMVILPGGAHVNVWGGGEVTARGRLAQALANVVRAASPRKLFGKYRYRVVRMAGARVELQAVASEAGLPDLSPVTQKPGVAGAHAVLTGGSIVLVEFIEGNPTLPLVVAYTGQGEDPQTLDLSVVTTLRLGGAGATDAVALAPTIDSQFDDINAALDAYAATLPVVNDGGAALQTALKTAWGAGAPPKPPSNVGATKVVAE